MKESLRPPSTRLRASGSGRGDKKFNHLLGKLEAEIMDEAWECGKCSVRDILIRLKKKRKIAYTTVMTVMTRLTGKGLLKRELDRAGAYVYACVKNKEAFLATTSKKAVHDLIREFGDVAVAQFMDVLEKTDKKKLKEWRQKLRNIK